MSALKMFADRAIENGPLCQGPICVGTASGTSRTGGSRDPRSLIISAHYGVPATAAIGTGRIIVESGPLGGLQGLNVQLQRLCCEGDPQAEWTAAGTSTRECRPGVRLLAAKQRRSRADAPSATASASHSV